MMSFSPSADSKPPTVAECVATYVPSLHRLLHVLHSVHVHCDTADIFLIIGYVVVNYVVVI